tara:strand:+ start:1317 stop:1520 length:204 start_codon:yes stop_codon:yes gene_type:complete
MQKQIKDLLNEYESVGEVRGTLDNEEDLLRIKIDLMELIKKVDDMLSRVNGTLVKHKIRKPNGGKHE